MRGVLDQLARSALLPEEMAAAIIGGSVPPIQEIVREIVIGAMDAEAVVSGDPKSTWNERRIARLCLGIAFISALACTSEQSDPE